MLPKAPVKLFVQKTLYRYAGQKIPYKGTKKLPKTTSKECYKKREKWNARTKVIVRKRHLNHRYKSLSVGKIIEMLLENVPLKHTVQNTGKFFHWKNHVLICTSAKYRKNVSQNTIKKLPFSKNVSKCSWRKYRTSTVPKNLVKNCYRKANIGIYSSESSCTKVLTKTQPKIAFRKTL